jgi:DNA-binding NarL/FixJ family response regulator
MPSAAPIRVLLCDDADAFRALVRTALADDPAIEVVGEAADGDACVQAVAGLQPDVVLLDLSMPRCDGLQAIPRVRQEAPGASIVALSSFCADRMAQTVLDRGAVAYLQKGGDLSAIRTAILAAAAL